jgi:hypothetical protein
MRVDWAFKNNKILFEFFPETDGEKDFIQIIKDYDAVENRFIYQSSDNPFTLRDVDRIESATVTLFKRPALMPNIEEPQPHRCKSRKK